ncbi:efflux RND transporter periplasmic adaptor subunit [Pseudomonas mediterranea]|uniref:efflux RND transporter periplasmic adaptor subunit n=1 Tax=Pseudomonas mediterranea TaxID=183795 RepID=UPI0013184A29|nr:efflux RND transporter periplasmic adaptor subunit [Pseudomonas mediterranea]QHA82021.1 efflux RND transporter periplasmic adaptor subunit [Pseudomonas mediterranea]
MISSLFEIGISRYVPVILLATFILSACKAEDKAHPDVPRPVKVEKVTTQAQKGLRLIGTVQSQSRADLSFEIGGVLDQLSVHPGQEVRKGAVLAQLDRQPAQLKLMQAKAKLLAQKAQVTQGQQLRDRSKRLFADGTVAKKDVEQAEVQYQSAVAERDIDESSVRLAQREYALTQLVAPFNGRVVSYAVEPHAQVSAAQTVIQMVAAGSQDVIAQIPVDQAKGLMVGDEALGFDESQQGTTFKLKLRSVSPEAKGGVLREAKFEVISPNVRLVDGTTLSLQLAADSEAVLMTLPQQALRGTSTGEGAEVFIYEPHTGRVVRRAIQLAGMEGARLIVREGLSQGELVVTAGTAFLTDQQVVTLFKPTTNSVAE